jgi:DNA-binding response OmpR family regulator
MSLFPGIDVLIVEDDRPLSDMLAWAIQRDGLTTDVAGDVAEAKRLLARGSYKVLVLDLLLPDGTGFDLLDFMRAEKLPRLQIVVITAADASLLVKIDRSLVKSVTFKPLDVEQFVASVRSLAGDHSTPKH